MYLYILPTVKGHPPRALIMEKDPQEAIAEAQENDGVGFVPGIEVMFSQDMGMWMHPNGNALPQGLGEALTERAKELGVRWE